MTTRRRFLQLAGLGAAGLFASGCAKGPNIAGWFGNGAASGLGNSILNGSIEERRAVHVLNRLGYGPRPGDVARVVETGVETFVNEQLAPDSIPDFETTWKVRRIETLNWNAGDLFGLTGEEVLSDLRRATVLRAVGSSRQLLETMVEFWTDHFNILGSKSDCAWLKVVDDREVIRPHALGKFRDLLRATATSPAMLLYLDGSSNAAGKPNENYARELMELHTFGVGGGYSQQDVTELARALTGWTVGKRFRAGRAVFKPELHDAGVKTVLSDKLDSSAEADLERIIDMLSAHPSTANFIAVKLCRRFVADNPSPELVKRVAGSFSASGGDIRETLRTIFAAPEFWNAPPLLKRPFTFAVSALRAVGASTDGGTGVQDHLRAMGQQPFNWPTPDGYPDGAEHWQGQLLPRWNFAAALCSGTVKGTALPDELLSLSPEKLAQPVLHREPTEAERSALRSARSPMEALTLLVCSPAFQYK